MQLFQSQGGRGDSLFARTKMPSFCEYLQAQKPQTISNSWKHFCSRRLPPGVSIKTNIKMTAYNGRPPTTHLSLEFVKSAKIIVFSCPTESLPQLILSSVKEINLKTFARKCYCLEKKKLIASLHWWGLTFADYWSNICSALVVLKTQKLATPQLGNNTSCLINGQLPLALPR